MREALKLALEALESSLYPQQKQLIAITTIKEALSKPSNPGELEPVAWTTGLYGGYCVIRAANPAAILPLNMALYTTPPQRNPLTDEEVRNLWDGHVVPVFGKNGINPIVFARAIEAAHGIKENT